MPTMKLSGKSTVVLAVLTVLLLLSAGAVCYVELESSRPWKRYQRAFNALDMEITRKEREALEARSDEGEGKKERLTLLDRRAEGIECRTVAVKQFWLTGLGVTDRCMSCHQGVESPRFKDVEQPFTTHPGRHLAADRHPVHKFGCVVCHDGQGVALTKDEAHALTDIWLKPVLRNELAEASCRRCHAYDDTVPRHIAFPDAPHLTNGKRLYLEKGCMGCHVLKGFEVPQRIAPMLTRVIEKVNAGWMKQWITKPNDYLPLTIMPFFDLKDEEVEQLGAFLDSLSSVSNKESEKLKIKGNAQKGGELFQEVGCLACHTVNDSGGLFGPDLSRVAEKVKEDTWLLNWVEDPVAYDRETEMPDFRLDEEQIQDIAAYLMTLKKQERPGNVSFDAELLPQGKQLFGTLGCTGCHKIEGMVYGFPRSPEHTGYADKGMDMFDFGHVTDIPRTKAAWTKKKLEEPKVFSTETIKLVMPDVGLKPEEIRDLRVWMLSLAEHEAPEEYLLELQDSESPFLKGMRVVEKFNCTGCHKFGLMEREMELNDDFPEGYFWASTTYAIEDIEVEGEVLYAKGSELNKEQVAALLNIDPELDNLLFRRRWFVDYDNAGYLMDMELAKIKVLGMNEGDIMGNYKDLNFAPPILHYEGAKVQPNWLYEFLDNPYPVRPLTKATMPTFNLTGEQIDELVVFFVDKEGLEHPYFPVEELKPGEAEKAEEVFKICLQCHYFDQERLQDKKGFKDLKGPNLAEVKRRIRPEYIRQWVKYPDLIIPGTQMKNFFYDFDVDARFEEIDPDETGITDLTQEEKVGMMSRFLMNPYKNYRLSVQR